MKRYIIDPETRVTFFHVTDEENNEYSVEVATDFKSGHTEMDINIIHCGEGIDIMNYNLSDETYSEIENEIIKLITNKNGM